MQPLIIAIYMRKLAILERKPLEPVTGAVVLWEMFESSHYPWSGLWWLHKCLQACCYLAEHRIYSSWFKRSWPLISEVLTGLFPLLHKENSFKYLFYFFSSFSAQDSAPLWCCTFIFFKCDRLLRQHFQAQKVFVAGHCGDTCNGCPWVLHLMLWLLHGCSATCPHPKAFMSSSLQHLPSAPRSMEVIPPNGTAWIKLLSLAGADKCHSPSPASALSATSFCVLPFLSNLFYLRLSSTQRSIT